MDIKILNNKLSGIYSAPISKSSAHRYILSSALSGNLMTVISENLSDDLTVSYNAGQIIEKLAFSQNVVYDNFNTDSLEFFCGESGTTLRMFLPAICALYENFSVTMLPSLAARPIDHLLQALSKGGCKFTYKHCGRTGLSKIISKNKFRGCDCTLPGNISSQYISGMLFALALSEKGGKISLSSHLQSAPYVEMTLDVLAQFGINYNIFYSKNSISEISVPGKQNFKYINSSDSTSTISLFDVVEGDWSSAAFFIIASAVGNSITITGLSNDTLQGDKKIYDIISYMSQRKSCSLNLSDQPDLLPVLAIYAATLTGTTRFTGLERLKYKESNRIISTTSMLQALKCKCNYDYNSITVYGTGKIQGGTVDSFGDHRIAMAAAVAATTAESPITVTSAQCIRKSYPEFISDFRKLGGKIIEF